MYLIDCPYCGTREQVEFSYGGEAHVARPEGDALDDAEWSDFVFLRTNTKGVFAERWCHSHGCGKWFNALRNTATDRFLAFYKINERRPEISEPELPTPAGEPEIGSGADATKVRRDGGPG